MVRNYMTVDFEEWFHGLSSTGRRPEIWPELENRIDIGAEFLLETFEAAGIKATFFMVGVLAEERPDLVRTIHDAGHEIGLHGHWHRHVWTLTPEEFENDIRANTAALRSACDAPIDGFRAPAFSVKLTMPWVWEKLTACGLTYSSSLFPIRTPLYGAPDAPLLPHRRGAAIEIPMSVLTIVNGRVPFSGGFYFRALPYKAVHSCTRALNGRDTPVVFYFHPWEFDPDHPRPTGISTREKVSHYLGLKGAREKLRRLCSAFEFAPLGDWAESLS